MIRICSLIGLLCLLINQTFAQSLSKQADRQFDQLAYAQAVDLYEKALTGAGSMSEAERKAAKVKLGYSYHQMHDTKNAERVYRDLIQEGDLPNEYAQSYLYYAQALASNGKYKESQQVYEKYNKVQNDDRRGPKFSTLYRDVTPLTRNADSYQIEFLKLNTKKAEFSPMLYKGGLVFVSTGEPNGIKRVFKWNTTPFLDLYYLPEEKELRATAARVGGSAPKKKVQKTNLIRPLGSDDYTAPTANDTRTVGFYGINNINAGSDYSEEAVSESDRFSQSLNTKYHEGPATFTKDGSRIIFTRNNYNDGKFRKSSDGVNKLKLYTATQSKGYWSSSEELPFNSDEYSTGHPALSPDDKLLYFVSDRPGGFGGTDLYVAKWDAGKWGEPINLGKEVNTKGNEMFPFVDEKGNLYIASDGQAGLGGLDMFYVQLTEDGMHSKGIRNLGEPLNSPQDDFGIVTDAERKAGYFSSNRKNGGADDDVYRFTRVGSIYPCRELTISVFDAESKEPLANTSVAVENVVKRNDKQVKTDAEGLMKICLDEDSEFKFVASREGYLDNKIGFSTKDFSDDQPSRLEIPLTKPKEEPKPTITTNKLRGIVTTQKDKKPIPGVKVVLVNGCDGTSQETITGADGSYEFTVQSGCDYTLEAMKDNMGTAGGRINKDGTGSPDLTMFKKGDVIKIDNIYYDLNKSAIRPDAALELDKVVELMKKYPAMKIEMRSHTDSRASATYNKTLSSNRAKAAVTYLSKKGISSKRMIAKGYGESALLNKCKDGVNCPEEDHQQNRRTEIKILTLE